MKSAALIIALCLTSSGQEFEVASIKPAARPNPLTAGRRGGPGTENPVRISWTYANLKSVILEAYDVRAFQVSGPSWLESEHYDFAVNVPPETTAAQLRSMWQHLLEDRFKVVVRREQKLFDVDELTIAPGGHKLKDTTYAGPPTEGMPKFENGKMISPGMYASPQRSAIGEMVNRIVAKAQTPAALMRFVSQQLPRPVIDATGLTGKYDFDLEYSNPEAKSLTPDLITALRQQLGLRLTGTKAMLDHLTVETAERVPSEN